VRGIGGYSGCPLAWIILFKFWKIVDQLIPARLLQLSVMKSNATIDVSDTMYASEIKMDNNSNIQMSLSGWNFTRSRLI
jgi:hypothetical protein